MAATLHTSMGDIKIELFCDRAPRTCENFLALAASNYYDDTLFHRNIKGQFPAQACLSCASANERARQLLERLRQSRPFCAGVFVCIRQECHWSKVVSYIQTHNPVHTTHVLQHSHAHANSRTGFMLQGGDPTGTGKGGMFIVLIRLGSVPSVCRGTRVGCSLNVCMVCARMDLCKESSVVLQARASSASISRTRLSKS